MPPGNEVNVAVAFRDKLIQKYGFTAGKITLTLEDVEKNDRNKDLLDCLKVASKSGKSKQGRPDLNGYNIPNNDRLIFLVEIKPTKKAHQGPHHLQIPNIVERQKTYPKDIVNFAVDGVHWYMHACREKFSVIGLAVSGTKEEVEDDSYSFSAFFQRRSEPDENGRLIHYDPVPLTYNNPAQSPVNMLIKLEEFLDAADYNPQFLANAKNNIEETKAALSQILDSRYVEDDKRALTLSSLLVALQDENCRDTLLGSEDHQIRIEAILAAYERQMTGNELLEEDAAVVEATLTEETGGEEE